MQSSRFTVKADGKQNSRLVNFVLEQRLPFAKISFIYRKRLGRRDTGIKDSFEEVEHEFPFGTFRPQKKKTGLPYQMFRCSRKFSTGTTQKVVFHLVSNRIFRILFVHGKQPKSSSFFKRFR